MAMSEPPLPGDEGEGSLTLTSSEGRSCGVEDRPLCWRSQGVSRNCSHADKQGNHLCTPRSKQGGEEQPTRICHGQIISCNLISL